METATKNSDANTILADLKVMKPTLKRYSDKLAALGIETRDYPQIKDDSIRAFLQNRLAKMPLKFYGAVDYSGFDPRFGWSGHLGVQRNFHKVVGKRWFFWDRYDDRRRWVYGVAWREADITEYPGFMPEHVLDAAIRAKQSGYTDLRIVTIEEEQAVVPPYVDPLLIAYKGKRRFLIDYWDKDIDPTELETE